MEIRGRRFIKAGGGVIIPPTPTPNEDIVFEVTFASNPENVLTQFESMKYGKKALFCPTWDHADNGIAQALPYLSGKFFTDGCGKQIAFRGSMCINVRNPYHNGIIWPKEILQELIAKYWDIENHGYYHDWENTNFSYGDDPVRNTAELDAYVYDLLKFKVNGTIVPDSHQGFANAAKNIGYAFSCSQGQFDNNTPEPLYTVIGDYANLQVPFAAVRRDFSDELQAELASKKANIDLIMSQTGKFYVLSSHLASPAFPEFIDYVQTAGNDQLLICSIREALEYKRMISLPKTQVLTNNKLRITINTASLSDRVRFRDVTLKLTANPAITGVEVVSGADEVTFNNTTKRINVYKKHIWA